MAEIVVVEDNAANLDLMMYLLRAFGHRPVAAHDAEEGLERIRNEPPDLIICDIQLPGADGYEVARQLKGRPATRSIPLLAVTAYAMVGDRERMLAAGFDGYLAKPINPETFVSEVETFLKPSQRASSPRPVAPPAVADTPQTSRQWHATVLAVEDSPANLQYICSLLEPSGYRVIAANRVSEATDLARKQPPDLILCDVHLERESGLDFLRAVRSDPRLRAIPFIFVTASAPTLESATAKLAAGVSRFLVRPIEPQILLGEIEACLNERSERTG